MGEYSRKKKKKKAKPKSEVKPAYLLLLGDRSAGTNELRSHRKVGKSRPFILMKVNAFFHSITSNDMSHRSIWYIAFVSRNRTGSLQAI